MALLQDLAVVMVVAGVVTVLFHRLKQPVVLGYILAGFIIGPHTPPYPLIRSEETINTLAELGVILLMFSLGLEFSLRKLRQVGGTATLAALLEIFTMGWVGYGLGQLFGWSGTDSLFLGAMLSMSSTTIIIKVLAELGRTRERFSQLIFGILIVEDILGIAMIALLSGIAMTGELGLGSVGATLGKLAAFLAVVLVAGLIAVPRLLGYVARFKSDEVLLVAALGLCFGVSLLATKLGYSVALGAFVIGAVIAESREIHRIATLIEPVRDMFSAVFFVAIGLLIEPRMLLEHWAPILAITVAVIVCKVIACSAGTFLGGHDTKTSLRVGMSVAQIGEFSFIIASLGVSLRVTSEFLYPVAVAVSAITTLLTPYLIRASDGTADRLERLAPRPVMDLLRVYTRWVGSLDSHKETRSDAGRLIRRWCLQIGLNAVLLAAVFLGAAVLGRRPPEMLRRLDWAPVWRDTALWFAATVLALPLVVATVRKLQALGLVVAETKVSENLAGARTVPIRAIVAGTIPIAGTVILGFYMLALSATLLPPAPVLLVLLVVVAALGWALRRSFSRLYSRAQGAIEETFATPAAETPKALPPLLREADLATVALAADSPAAGRLIRELELRSRTGASIVGIERAGANILNPGPDEELCAGDHLVLLGAADQLRAATALITAGAGSRGTGDTAPG
ncbi:MAG TPA: cation:proton antiporter [Opitutaceae bacterium]|nr:cation:proton antiporter [Opitutaceae bacterium]